MTKKLYSLDIKTYNNFFIILSLNIKIFINKSNLIIIIIQKSYYLINNASFKILFFHWILIL
jgi:hypothetical protein